MAQHLAEGEYSDFYIERQQAGDFIILDNGAYENLQPLREDLFVNAIQWLKPTVTVLPDFPLQRAHLTVSAALRFLDKYCDLPTEWMFVPQSTPDDLNSWYAGLNSVMADMRVGQFVKWCGLPRNLHTHFGGQRVHVAAVVKTLYPGLRLHALGMGSGSITEFNDLRPFTDSIDSSCAVWRGWNHTLLNTAWEDIPLEMYAAPPDDAAVECIEQNLEMLSYGYGKEVARAIESNSGR